MMQRKLLILWLLIFGVMGCLLFNTMKAEALEPKLIWKKDFKVEIKTLDFATETGEVLISLKNGEIIIYDKNGHENFHWGPRQDQGAGWGKISKDGKYFLFLSGYLKEYSWEDERLHFYDGKTKKEL